MGSGGHALPQSTSASSVMARLQCSHPQGQPALSLLHWRRSWLIELPWDLRSLPRPFLSEDSVCCRNHQLCVTRLIVTQRSSELIWSFRRLSPSHCTVSFATTTESWCHHYLITYVLLLFVPCSLSPFSAKMAHLLNSFVANGQTSLTPKPCVELCLCLYLATEMMFFLIIHGKRAY